MNRITKLFQEKQDGILSIYYTAGFPHVDQTLAIAQYIEEAGADMIEIGIPFSDPVADGPTIQQSNKTALDNGMTLKLLFEQIRSLRDRVTIPVILMGYVNPVLQYGMEAFCQQCRQVGIDGLILPDLPVEEYLRDYQPIFRDHGLKNVFLITPQTAEKRIRQIDENTDGFIYMVSSASTTGAKNGFGTDQIEYFESVEALGLKNPTLVGFGIANRATFGLACDHANGAIIGSAFINVLANGNELKDDIKEFIQTIIKE